MALRTVLAKRLSGGCKVTATSQPVTLGHSPISSVSSSIQSVAPPNAAKTNLHREYLTSSESAEKGFFKRFLHRRAVNHLPELFSLPVGEKLREKLKGFNKPGDRLHLDGITPPATTIREANMYGISIQDARKLLRLSLAEKLKAKLREIPNSSISYSDFVHICVKECGNEDQGLEFAKTLDQSGNVIVLGNTVFLRPKQLAQSMNNLISESMATPNDPRREQLEQMEKQKAIIDRKAEALVRGELYCGLGLLVAQTLGFMRLTFWELSWDVMEPICFFVTSLHFAVGYGFFIRTSTEPSFEGYFRRRFMAKQRKLMKIQNFDVEKYNELRKFFNPQFGHGSFNYSVMHH